MSPQKKLHSPRSGKELQDLQKNCNLPKPDQQLKDQCENSIDQTVPVVVMKNTAVHVTYVQQKKAKRVYARNSEVNIPKASELLEPYELDQSNSNIKVYTVYSKDVLLQKMSDVQAVNRPKPKRKSKHAKSKLVHNPMNILKLTNKANTVCNPRPTNESQMESETSSVAQFPSTDVNKEIWRESMVWKYFLNVQGGASCKVCGRILKVWRGGTLSLENHLYMRHRLEYELFQKECTNGIGGVTPTMKEPVRTYSRVRKPLLTKVETPTCNNQLLDTSKTFDPLQLNLPENKTDLLLDLKSELPDLISDDEKLVLNGKEQETQPEVNPEQLLTITSIKNELIDTYNFGNFKKNSMSVLEDSPVGKSAGTISLIMDFRPKEGFKCESPVEGKWIKTRRNSAQKRVKDEPPDDAHTGVVLECIDEPYEPVKQTILTLDIPEPESENLDIIVPDPVSELPVWLKKEPELDRNSMHKQKKDSEISSAELEVLKEIIKKEAPDEVILG